MESVVISKKDVTDLDALESQIAAARDKRPKPHVDDGHGTMLGMVLRLSTEMVVSLLVGMGIGFGLDKLFGTNPWIMLIGIGFGFAAGIRNTLRLADRMDAHDADVALGDDIGFDDLDKDD